MPRIASLANITSFTAKLKGIKRAVYALTNSGANDPTSQAWRNNYAPASYEWIPNQGIYVDEGDPITNMRNIFNNNTTFNDPDISTWDTESVTDMAFAFYNTYAFNQDISSWNTSNVTDMSYMFQNALVFNQDLGGWNVDNVTDMGFMFLESKFNYDISNWNTTNVTKMWYMFAYTPFNQDISSWNTSNVTHMYRMFYNATAFNQDISNWDVSSVTLMADMFNGASAFNQDLTGWNVTSMTIDTIPQNFNLNSALPAAKLPLFGRDGSQLKYYPITNSGTTDPTDSYWRSVAPASATWIAGRGYITDIADPITNMDSMFAYNSTFNDSDLQYWDVSSVTNMYSMFVSCSDFDANISSWNVGTVTNMNSLFFSATSFNQNLGSWNVGAVTDMSYMFRNAQLFNQDISSWTVNNVSDMTQMFYNATAFNQDLTGWNVSSVTSNANFSLNANSSWTQKPIPVTNNFTGQQLVQWGGAYSELQTLSNNNNYELFSDSQIAGSLSNVTSLQLTSTFYSQPTQNQTTQTMTFIGQNGSPDQQYYYLPSTSQVTTFYTGDLLPYIYYNSSSGKYLITIKIESTASSQQFFPPYTYRWNHQYIELSLYFSVSWAIPPF